jgi:chromosome segregation ATPase
MKSLAWVLAITLLAIVGSAAEEEPARIASYKREIANVIDVWADKMQQLENALHTVVEDWSAARNHLFAVIEARHRLEHEREGLEKEKRDLEKRLSDLQRDHEKRPGNTRPADAATINQIKEEIRKKGDEINLRMTEMKKVEERREHIEKELPAKRQKVADAAAQMTLLKPLIESIASVTSPASDAQTLEKDASGQYRMEWGPALQRWITAQIAARTQKWTDAPVVVNVVWLQTKFAQHSGPSVVANIKLPDLERRP